MHTLYLCVLCFSEEKTAICATYALNWLIFITEKETCLLRGTNLVFK